MPGLPLTLPQPYNHEAPFESHHRQTRLQGRRQEPLRLLRLQLPQEVAPHQACQPESFGRSESGRLVVLREVRVLRSQRKVFAKTSLSG